MVPVTVSLGPRDVIADRPFTATELTIRDLGILHGILADVRSVVVEAEELVSRDGCVLEFNRREVVLFDDLSRSP